MILIGRGLQHKVTNTGTEQMRLLWLITPPGLEDWFRAIGRPRHAQARCHRLHSTGQLMSS